MRMILERSRKRTDRKSSWRGVHRPTQKVTQRHITGLTPRTAYSFAPPKTSASFHTHACSATCVAEAFTQRHGEHGIPTKRRTPTRVGRRSENQDVSPCDVAVFTTTLLSTSFSDLIVDDDALEVAMISMSETSPTTDDRHADMVTIYRRSPLIHQTDSTRGSTTGETAIGAARQLSGTPKASTR